MNECHPSQPPCITEIGYVRFHTHCCREDLHFADGAASIATCACGTQWALEANVLAVQRVVPNPDPSALEWLRVLEGPDAEEKPS